MMVVKNLTLVCSLIKENETVVMFETDSGEFLRLLVKKGESDFILNVGDDYILTLSKK